MGVISWLAKDLLRFPRTLLHGAGWQICVKQHFLNFQTSKCTKVLCESNASKHRHFILPSYIRNRCTVASISCTTTFLTLWLSSFVPPADLYRAFRPCSIPFLLLQRCFAVQTNFSIIRHTRWFCLCLYVTNALSCYPTPQFLKQLPYFTVNWYTLKSIWEVIHWLLSSSIYRPVTAPNLPYQSLRYMTDLHHILVPHFDVSLVRPI